MYVCVYRYILDLIEARVETVAVHAQTNERSEVQAGETMEKTNIIDSNFWRNRYVNVDVAETNELHT